MYEMLWGFIKSGRHTCFPAITPYITLFQPEMGSRHFRFVILTYDSGNKFAKMKGGERRCAKIRFKLPSMQKDSVVVW